MRSWSTESFWLFAAADRVAGSSNCTMNRAIVAASPEDFARAVAPGVVRDTRSTSARRTSGRMRSAFTMAFASDGVAGSASTRTWSPVRVGASTVKSRPSAISEVGELPAGESRPGFRLHARAEAHDQAGHRGRDLGLRGGRRRIVDERRRAGWHGRCGDDGGEAGAADRAARGRPLQAITK